MAVGLARPQQPARRYQLRRSLPYEYCIEENYVSVRMISLVEIAPILKADFVQHQDEFFERGLFLVQQVEINFQQAGPRTREYGSSAPDDSIFVSLYVHFNQNFGAKLAGCLFDPSVQGRDWDVFEPLLLSLRIEPAGQGGRAQQRRGGGMFDVMKEFGSAFPIAERGINRHDPPVIVALGPQLQLREGTGQGFEAEYPRLGKYCGYIPCELAPVGAHVKYRSDRKMPQAKQGMARTGSQPRNFNPQEAEAPTDQFFSGYLQTVNLPPLA
jgi:hypothetical protein